MFKLTGASGSRKSGGNGRGAGTRVNANHLTSVTTARHPVRPAFLPDTPQESSFDSPAGPRFQGLEQRYK